MQIISIIVLIIAGIYIIFEMNKSLEIPKSEWFQKFDKSDKMIVIGFLKSFWKKSIISISLLVSWLFIIISTFLGKGTRYESGLCGLAIFCSIISIVILIISKNKYYNNANNFKR